VLLSLEALERYWAAAATNEPLLIVGAGRWGRVLAGVAKLARGDDSLIGMVARSNAFDTREWIAANAPGAIIGETIADGLDRLSDRAGKLPAFAIVATRPRDHVEDGLALLSRGIPTLVEKPMSHDPAGARRLLAAAGDVTLGMGIEMSLLPGLHHLAAVLAADGISVDRVELAWSDPSGEARYGATKRMHEEIGVLEDILPHALSMLRVLRPGPGWSVERAVQAGDKASGSMTLAHEGGLIADISCSWAGERRRLMQLFSAGWQIATLDFAQPEPKIHVRERLVAMPTPADSFTSTLRLEIGAFSLDAAGRQPASPLSSGLETFLELHEAGLREIAGQKSAL